MESQIQFLGDIWSELPGQLQVHYSQIMSVLKTKLQASIDLLDGLTPIHADYVGAKFSSKINRHSLLNRGIFALTTKEVLKSSLSEIQVWQFTFQLS